MEKKCLNCRYSIKYDVLTCNKLSEELDVIHPDTGDSIMYISYSDDVAAIVVKPNFGCIHWVKK